MMDHVMENAERQSIAISKGWLVALVILAVLILGDLNRRMADARRLEREGAQLEAEVAALQAENDRLAYQIEHAEDDELVEAWARSEAKLIREGERLIVPVPATSTNDQADENERPSFELPTNWQVWLELLFGR